MTSPKHLPPQALNEWLAAAAAELGLDEESVSIGTVLDVARDIAHGVARPAAPLSTFLLGMAVGRADDPRAALDEHAAALTALSERWPSTAE